MTTETLDARRFRALRQDWASEDLARFFLLTPEDMREVRTCRGASNRFGFALNLLLLRLLYCPLSEVNLTPARIVQFVAMQLNVHPEVLAEYSTRRPQTRDEHLVQIRGYLKLRPYVHEEDDPHLAEHLLSRALQRDDPAVLLEEAEDWLREEGILFPAESTISKIIAQVRPQAESQVFAALMSQLIRLAERTRSQSVTCFHQSFDHQIGNGAPAPDEHDRCLAAQPEPRTGAGPSGSEIPSGLPPSFFPTKTCSVAGLLPSGSPTGTAGSAFDLV